MHATVSDVLVRPAADAFLQVGVWVAVMLFAFAVLQWRTGGRVERRLAGHRRLGPLAGALLGATPGCGGAILVMPLYTRGTVSFGTVVATLVATMGDSSFVLIAAAPGTALGVHALLLATGLVAGYAVDRAGFAPDVTPVAPPRRGQASTVGAAAAEVDLAGRLAYRFPSPAMVGFWGVVAAGLVLSVLVVFEVAAEESLTVMSAGVNPYLVVGAIGTLGCAGIFVRNGGRLAEDCVDVSCRTHESLRRALRSAARETAFVTVWVAAAFSAYATFEAATGLETTQLPAVGLAGVVIGALVGLVPGCGPQILLTGLYAQGVLPLSTLVANALSQDGDALLPLLARDRRSALAATAVTTLPALAVGGALHLAGF